ncbi:MAG: DUF1043 family protein [Gammaproteobacteria bacterium]|nr:DUF1043 family protein [Gammaproteobacteria bacterium]
MISIPVILIFLLILLPTAVFIGWQARTWLGLPSELEKSLILELEAAKDELKKYQIEVNNHFEKTAQLFNQVLRQSKQLYDHLLNSSKELCYPDTTISSMNIVNTDPENWQELIIKPAPLKTSNFTNFDTNSENDVIDHNWHPTYFEARDATKFDHSKITVKPVSSVNKTDKTDKTDSIIREVTQELELSNEEKLNV